MSEEDFKKDMNNLLGSNAGGVKCNQSLVRSFGLKGLPESQWMKLTMCPKVHNSCCMERDQLKIFRNWELGQEENKLKQRLEFYEETYMDSLDIIKKIMVQVRKLNKFLETKKTGNCQILSRKLKYFRMEWLIPKLKTAITDMYEFFDQAYKGFYCTICDSDNHKYFKKKEIHFSSNFCREIITNSFHMLMYFHVHFTQYLNLITRFITSCNYKGKYFKTKVPDEFIFELTKEKHEMIDICKKHVNETSWFQSCRPICEKFHPIKFDEFFSPHMKILPRFNRFLRLKLAEYEEEQLINSVGKVPKRRLTKMTPDLNILYSNPDIILSSINSVIKIDKMKANFENEEGINMYETGSNVSIDEGSYTNLLYLEKNTLYNAFVGNSFGNNFAAFAQKLRFVFYFVLSSFLI